MTEYPATTKAELFAALRHVPDDAEIRIPSEFVGVTVPLGRVITRVFVGEPCHELAENVFDDGSLTRSAAVLLPDDDETVAPAGDASPNYTL
jgi:hypothetical protein